MFSIDKCGKLQMNTKGKFTNKVYQFSLEAIEASKSFRFNR